jgi:hypothetical protein
MARATITSRRVGDKCRDPTPQNHIQSVQQILIGNLSVCDPGGIIDAGI